MAVLLLAGEARAASPFLDPLWDDGQAEVARYDGRGVREGAERDLEAALILVKERFDRARGVKQEAGEEALKLNLLLSARTGVYEHRQMLSLHHARATLEPLRLAFTSQEWCGTTAKLWRARGEASRLETRSYFEDEGERDFPLPAAPDLVFEDALPVVLRADPTPRRLRLVSSQLSNRALAPQVAEASVQRADEEVLVPTGAGPRRGRELRVLRGAAVDRLWLDRDPPHVLLRWERASGDRLVLRSLERMAYWRLNRPEDEPRGRRPSGTPPAATGE